jgi:hypothetical protein
MTTARIFAGFTKENAKKVLTEGSIISYSLTNAVLYVKEPSALLQHTIMAFMNWVNSDNDDINNPVAMGLSYSLVGFAAMCLALQNYKSYSKIVREYDQGIKKEKLPEPEMDLEKAEIAEKSIVELPLEEEEAKVSCTEKLKSNTASLLKTVGASYSWFKLINEIPAPGFGIVAAVTTGLSVPGNIHSQIALLSSSNKKKVESDPTAYQRMRN